MRTTNRRSKSDAEGIRRALGRRKQVRKHGSYRGGRAYQRLGGQ